MTSLFNWLSEGGGSFGMSLLLTAVRVTLILALAWLAQAALRYGSPRLRILLWRFTAVGLVFVFAASQLPFRLTLPLLPSRQPTNELHIAQSAAIEEWVETSNINEVTD